MADGKTQTRMAYLRERLKNPSVTVTYKIMPNVPGAVAPVTTVTITSTPAGAAAAAEAIKASRYQLYGGPSRPAGIYRMGGCRRICLQTHKFFSVAVGHFPLALTI